MSLVTNLDWSRHAILKQTLNQDISIIDNLCKHKGFGLLLVCKIQYIHKAGTLSRPKGPTLRED